MQILTFFGVYHVGRGSQFWGPGHLVYLFWTTFNTFEYHFLQSLTFFIACSPPLEVTIMMFRNACVLLDHSSQLLLSRQWMLHHSCQKLSCRPIQLLIPLATTSTRTTSSTSSFSYSPSHPRWSHRHHHHHHPKVLIPSSQVAKSKSILRIILFIYPLFLSAAGK